MPTVYSEQPLNWSEISSYVNQSDFTEALMQKHTCFFYDACSFCYHAKMAGEVVSIILQFMKDKKGMVVISRCIMMELASKSHILNPEYVKYFETMFTYGINIYIVDEEALFQVMSLCYSPNRAVNEMLMWAIRMIKGPTSTITKTFAENTLLNQHLLQGKKLDDKEIFRQFFAAVRDNKEEDDNLGEELLGICLYLLTQLPGEPDGKFCLMTDDKGAAGKINSMFKKTPENYRRKRMIFYSTPKLAMLLYKEKYITDQDTLIKMLHTATEGNMKVLGTQIYDLRSREISLTREELAEQIILNRIHVTF